MRHQTNEQICANCAYTQGSQSWCDGKYCTKINRQDNDRQPNNQF